MAFDLKPASLVRTLTGIRVLVLGWAHVIFTELAEFALLSRMLFI